jgi:quercetin dioxygenase-like cupin family protein
MLPDQYDQVIMTVLKFEEVPYEKVRDGLMRKIIHTDKLMNVLIDFSDGPWDKPEPPHSHPHEQTSYVAEGEILFFCEGEPEQHLKRGDMFAVPGGIKHTVQLLTEKVRLVDSFSPPREDFL